MLADGAHLTAPSSRVFARSSSSASPIAGSRAPPATRAPHGIGRPSVDAAIPGLGRSGRPDRPPSITIPVGLTLTTILSIVGLVSARRSVRLGAAARLSSSLAGKVTDDVFWIWVLVRNLIIAIGIGAAFAASAIICSPSLRERRHRRAQPVPRPVRRQPALGDRHARVVSLLLVFHAGCRRHRGPVPHALGVESLVAHSPPRSVLRRDRAHRTGSGSSSLFVGERHPTPLLASFASLIALLLWFTRSAQVILAGRRGTSSRASTRSRIACAPVSERRPSRSDA